MMAHGPRIAARTALLGLRDKPVELARGRSTIGFGENRSKGALYAQRLTDFSMFSFD